MDFWTAELLGSIGVFFLLAAFFLNLFGYWQHGSRAYQALNVVGAGLSCYSSHLIEFLPFVVLEGTWCLVAVIALVKSMGPTKLVSR